MSFNALSDADVTALGDAIIAVTRELAQSMPAPKGAPYYGLDLSLADPPTLDSFSQHGIFRKYERALALGGGLGGVLRWWATRFGCSVVGIEERAAVSGAAARLGQRSAVDEQTAYVCGQVTRLPLGNGRFTHVWGLEQLTGAADPHAALEETRRVLRPGGALAVFLASDEALERRRWMDRLHTAGFVGLNQRTLPRGRPPQFVQLARERLRARIALRPALAAAVDAGERVSQTESVTLLFAQRPS